MRKVFKKVISVLLVAVMVLGVTPISGFVGLEIPEFKMIFDSVSAFFDSFATKAKAEETATSGTCGDNLTWMFNEYSGELIISGSGEMKYFSYYSSVPWNSFATKITSVVLEEGVTSIGDFAFGNCDNLTSIVMPTSLEYIGACAFMSCSCLTEITIPSNIRTIGINAFGNCTGLTKVNYKGTVDSWCLINFEYRTDSVAYNASANPLEYAHDLYIDNILLTKAVISDNVKSINAIAFMGCSLEHVTIPNSVERIGEYAFSWCENLASVVLSNSIDRIENSTFSGCTGLTSIIIPNGVTSIGEGAFSGCTGLTSIIIPNGVTSIGNFAFSGCTGLTSITIPDSVTSIGYDAFYKTSYYNNINNWENDVLYIGNHLIISKDLVSENYKVKNGVVTIASEAFKESCISSVTFPNSLLNLGNSAFEGSKNLVSVDLNKIESIGENAFKNCSNLKSIKLNNVISIGRKAFHGTAITELVLPNTLIFTDCYEYSIGGTSFIDGPFAQTGLKKVTFEEGTKKIPDYCLSGCEILNRINLPLSVISIGSYAFYKCSLITDATTGGTEVNIGNCAFYGCTSLANVTTGGCIGNYSFYNCINISKISVGDIANEIGYHAFHNCTNLTNAYISNNVKKIGSSAFEGCKSLAQITIPDSATYIGYNAFRGCSRINSIVIPENVENIESQAFCDCTNLETVRYNATNCDQMGSDVFDNCKVSNIYISNTVEIIPFSAFSGCTGISSITIPESVKIIESQAFSGCTNLKTVNYNAINCDAKLVSDYLIFSNCPALSNINIGSKVENIPYKLFQGCTKISTITIPNSVTCIDSCAFKGCYNLSNLTLGENLTTVNYSVFEGCSSLTSITIPNSVTSIGQSAFENCTSLANVTIGNGVTSIGYRAFYECTSLANVTIGDRVPSIGSSAFENCTSLASVTIGNGVTNIDSYAFRGCDSLTSIIIPDNVTSIGYRAFYECTSLANVTVGNSVPSIGDSAFEDCISLKSITLPKSIERIYSSAFKKCYSLETVYYTGTKTQWKKVTIDSSNSPILNAQIYYNSTGPDDIGPQEMIDNYISPGPIIADIGSTVTIYAYHCVDGEVAEDQSEITWDSNNYFVANKVTASAVDSKYSVATFKIGSNGKAKVTATFPDGTQKTIDILAGTAAEEYYELSVDTNNVYLKYDSEGFEEDNFTLDVNVKCSGGNNLTKTSNPFNVIISLPTGMSFQKNSMEQELTFLSDSIKFSTEKDFSQTIYINNLSATETTKSIKIILEELSDNGKMQTLQTVYAKVYISSSEGNKVENLDNVGTTDKPQILEGNSTDDEKKIGKGSNIVVNDYYSVEGKLELDKGSILTVKGMLVADEIIVDGGELIVYDGGQITANKIIVKKGFITQYGGKIIVKKHIHFKSSSTSKMSGGTLWVGGEFETSNYKASFQANKSHSTIFYGSTKHKISFAWTSKADTTYFQNCYIDKNSTMSMDNTELSERVKGSFYNVNVDTNKMSATIIQGSDLDPISSWEKGVAELTTSENLAAIELRGDFTLTSIYSSKELKELGEMVSWWSVSVSAPIMSAAFDDINTLDYYMTVKDYAGKGHDLVFVIDGMAFGNWSNWGAVSWFSEDLGVPPEKMRAVGLFAGANTDRFQMEAAKYLAKEAVISLVKSYASSKLKDKYKNIVSFAEASVEAKDAIEYIANFCKHTKSMNISFEAVKNTRTMSLSSQSNELDISDYTSDFSDFKKNVMGTLSMPFSAYSTSASEITSLDSNQEVYFLDKNLNEAIHKSLGLDSSINITEAMASMVKSLDLSYSYITNLSGIEKFINLEIINLEGNYISDLSFLSKLNNLKTVNLTNNNISSIDSLTGLINLKYLSFSENMVKTLPKLSCRSNLIYLDASDNEINDFSQLSELTAVKYLNLSDNAINTGNLNSLSNLVNIEMLFVSDCGLTDIKGIKSKNLMVLDLSDNNITDVSFIEVSKLVSVDLGDNAIDDALIFEGATLLAELYLHNNLLNNDGIPMVSSMPQLSILNVSGNRLTNLCFLDDSGLLTYLDVSFNPLENINCVSNCKNIEYLHMDSCSVSDSSIESVSSLANIKEISIADNNISNLSFVKNLTKIAKIDIDNNMIAETEKNQSIISTLFDSNVVIVDKDDVVAVREVLLYDSEIEIENKTNKQLSCFILPNAATDKSVIWTSSNPDIATINENGMINALSVGTTVITVTTVDGEKTAQCAITVIPGTFTVSWNIDGEITSSEITEGTTIIKPNNPEKIGYVFKGWTPSIPKTMPAYDITFTAVFDTNFIFDLRNPSTTTISYGDAIILHADVTGTLPAGATIKWEASNGNFAMEVSADGKTCKISPSSKGDTTFTASVVDANGNVISSDEQVMTSKSGFFDKIIAFFKKLFGLTKTIPQIYKGIF